MSKGTGIVLILGSVIIPYFLLYILFMTPILNWVNKGTLNLFSPLLIGLACSFFGYSLSAVNK